MNLQEYDDTVDASNYVNDEMDIHNEDDVEFDILGSDEANKEESVINEELDEIQEKYKKKKPIFLRFDDLQS